MSTYHIPVLVSETIDALKVGAGERYIDATLGGGGHATAIIEKGGIVLGIDVDQEALAHVGKILRDKDIKIQREIEDKAHNILVSQYSTITLVRGNFKDIDVIAKENGFEQVAGILFDIGISSHQIDTAQRGFSFQRDAALDMRMDQSSGISAKELVNTLDKRDLAELFQKLGEERKARVIADHIVKTRERKPIETTGELAFVIQQAYGIKGFISPKMRADINKRVFQALRIAVNDELNAISVALPKALSLLQVGGRIAVITFHSLEDRIVQFVFEDLEKTKKGIVITHYAISASLDEVNHNPRSRSAKLRVFEKR